MRILILDLAKRDLIDGYHFYEEREVGLGGYFLDSLYSDIDSLVLYGGNSSKGVPQFSLDPFPPVSFCHLLYDRGGNGICPSDR